MKTLKTAAVCAVCAVLTGCSGISFSVDGLLSAPKLTDEQSEIHQALIAGVGNNITLKYPKNGNNRSAYVIANIDDEPDSEALVFYEYNSGTSGDDGIRVNLLDKDDEGKWYSVKELAGAGTDVDRVIISPIGNSNQLDVLVGYQTMTGEDKNLEIYNYSKGDFTRVGMDTYSLLEALDINGDGANEIVTIQKNTNADTGIQTAEASLLKVKNGEIVKEESVQMCPGIVSYTSSKVGYLNDDYTHAAIFADGINADGNLQTQIIYYRYSSLQNPMETQSDRLLPLCTRPAGYSCADMDGDGVVEIPFTQPMTGYENAVADEMLYITSWSVYRDFYQLEEEYKGYYSISDGYFFSFPNRWKDLVTIKKDGETGEIVFYKYEGEINSQMKEVMRIAVASKEQSNDYLDDGYNVIDGKGQLYYLVKLPSDKREQLILTIDEVQNNFYIVD